MLSEFPIYVDIPATDATRARRWYEDRLGLTPLMEFQGGLLYLSGGVPFYMYETAAAGSAGNTAASWIVDDLASLMDDLRGHGIVFENYDPGDIGPTTVNGVATGQDGALAAWFKDSEGNVLGLIQLPPGMTLPGRSPAS
jgi:catechol 2,3-dioxygenase-like lactoylglutathione lyase family enzyme